MQVFSALSNCILVINLFEIAISANISQSMGNLENNVQQLSHKPSDTEKFCSEDGDCQDNQKCLQIEGTRYCQCAEGLSGPNCEVLEWCKDTGKFQACKGENGTCEFSKTVRSVVCTCGVGKSLHPFEDRCKSNCIEDSECQHGGECQLQSKKKFCSCKGGFIGDKCEIVHDCTPSGRFKECKSSGGKCSYDMIAKKTVCECSGNKEFDDQDLKCNECDCGPYGSCYFSYGEKICYCKQFFAEKFGKCVECSCGMYDSKCGYTTEGRKICYCPEFYEVKGDYCIWGGDRNSSSSPLSIVEASTLPACNCGEKSTQCYYDKNLNKVCICLPGYVEKNGICSECYCGPHSWSCRFSSEGNRLCDCKPGYAQKNGTCAEMCLSSSDCLNDGICQHFESGSFCDCGPYFSGDRCEKSEICDYMKEKCEEIGAVCVPTRWKTTCECPKGKMFTPSGMCEDICDSAKCLFGKCEVFGKSYRCICERGFSGVFCDINNNIRTNLSILAISLVVFCFLLLSTLIGIVCWGCKIIRSKGDENSKYC